MPPSSNSMYVSAGRYRNLSPKARKWLQTAREALGDIPEPQEFLGQPLQVKITIESPIWICKNGNTRRTDVISREKILSDFIFSLWPNLDDSFIWDIQMIKVQAEHTKITYDITVYNRDTTLST